MEGPLRAPADPDFRIIETLGYHSEQGFIRRDRHLARMARTATALGIGFDASRAIECLSDVGGDDRLRCRLTLDVEGRFEVTSAAMTANPKHWRFGLADARLGASDRWLRHKTTQRQVYDIARSGLLPGVDELIFLNERDELCEGTITNLFLELPDGRIVTPALACGLLPGILREEMLENGQVTEAILNVNDLENARNIYFGNSLRGLIRAERANQ